MMGLMDDIANEQKFVRSNGAMESILAQLPEEDRTELIEALRDTVRFDATSIHRVLERRGFAVSERTVQRYRNKINQEV